MKTYSSSRTRRVPATPEEIQAAMDTGNLNLELSHHGAARWVARDPEFHYIRTSKQKVEGHVREVIDLGRYITKTPMRQFGEHRTSVLPYALPEQLFEARYPGGMEQFAEENGLVRMMHPYSDYAFKPDTAQPDHPMSVFRLTYSKDQTGSQRVVRWYYPRANKWSPTYYGPHGFQTQMFNTEDQKNDSASPRSLYLMLKDLPYGPLYEVGQHMGDVWEYRQKAMGNYPEHDPIYIPQEQPVAS